MRHRVEGRKFGREVGHRKALLSNLVKSLIIHKKINTTLAKAKELRRFAERMVTYGKRNSVHSRRIANKMLNDRSLVKILFDEISPNYESVNGGYTRVLKNGFRRGDNAPMAIIEFVKVNKEEVKVSADNIKAEDIVKEVSQEKEEQN